jgi:hypothetical protein
VPQRFTGKRVISVAQGEPVRIDRLASASRLRLRRNLVSWRRDLSKRGGRGRQRSFTGLAPVIRRLNISVRSSRISIHRRQAAHCNVPVGRTSPASNATGGFCAVEPSQDRLTGTDERQAPEWDWLDRPEELRDSLD